MESLLNAEVIKAAASSPLGVFSLMCLILGVIALAFFKKAQEWVRVLVFTMLLFGVGGLANAFISQESPDKMPEITRDFIIGRWQVEQKVGDLEGGSFIDYHQDGSFSGVEQQFFQGQGLRQQIYGQWDFVKLNKEEFRLILLYENGFQVQAMFKIIDSNRVQNIEENYVSVRVPK